MRKQHTVKKSASTRKTYEPPMRDLISAYPAKRLSSLVAQAKAPLEEALSNARLPADKTLTLFFSFTDGLQRATVVQFSGKHLDEVWKKLADWQHRKFKISPKVRWLRIDWVNEKRAMTWADCLKEMQSVKRNYFRFGISLDADFRYAFLEQELNANAMLYLGAKQPKAALNKKNFLTYGVKRYGKHFSLPAQPQDQVLLFTTQAILVQPDKSHELLHGYSGGIEGRNTGRRIIEQLDSPQVESLIQQSSQFLAEQVDTTGRFTYGIHPCFDRDIKAYNTLRHTSTTYSMLEAWEVTKSSELKSAIDRSIAYLTSDLIRQYTLPSGETLAYLQDSNKEIKLGGNAVCLLALVKYTELTNDSQHLPLMEQLALGIQRMQNQQNGQFYHVLNADDLSIKEEFRIIYYDGEAAFGLMRLYGLTKDERWLNTVEKAFEYFIEKEHWKIHDHWLSYCVNELTLYRPEERYYQFGIKNVAGHLDFVIGRITTFPTLLELMMAAHKMITRLEASDQHRHLLEQIDLKKFYRALEARAHYLLNGFFWPEFAIYFQNPQRIMGSFFIRHHSFRVRIDDVEHYLSGYVAYLLHYLQHGSQGKGRLSTPSTATSNASASTTLSAAAILTWGGDVNLGRRQHYRTQEKGYEQVLDIPELKNADLSIVNLECVVSTLGEQGINKGEGGPYYYRARPEMLKILTTANINAVTVANNHSGDYGPEALMQQQELLQKLGILCAGSGYNRAAAFSPAYCQAGKLKVALFSVDATQHRFAAQEDQPGAAYLSLQNAALWHKTFVRLFAEAKKQANLVIIAVHWGPNHAPAPEEDEIAVGHALIDAGADAILGASSHRLQGIEIYKNKPILHDAGDLLFDSVRSNLAGSGIFRLGLSKQGIRWVEFIPVGVGYGYSQRLQGEAAQTLISRYQQTCQKLGTTLHRQGDRALVELLPAAPPQPKAAPQQPSYQLDILKDFQPTAEHGQVAEVPEDAQVPPIELNGLTLLGVRVNPNQIKRRQMLWVETWWTCTQPLSEDRRLSLTAVPQGAGTMPKWGYGMDHDPCDWMQPTSRWQPGRIYHDYYGLRPPQMRQLENRTLQLEIRVLGTRPSDAAYLHPNTISMEIPNLPVSHLSRKYRTDFTGINLQVASGQTWTAAQLADITGGHWLVKPAKGWFTRSVVNGTTFVEKRENPVVFVAHTNQDRKFHEQYTKPLKSLQDRHTLLPHIANKLAGAIVTKPISGLPDDFPILQVSDPIRALMELGFAARQRYQGPVIAITGTAGKSSTIGLLETLFTPNRYIKSVDNYNSRVGAPAQLANLAPDHQAALIEIAQSALWMNRGPITRQIKPTIAVITEIGVSQTNQKVKNSRDTAKWKSCIFDGLAPGGIAVIGEHLTHFDLIYDKATQHASRILTFGPSPQASLQVQSQRTEGVFTRLELKVDRRNYCLDIPFTNKGMVRNALATLTIAYALGHNLESVAAKLHNYQPEDGRLVDYTCQLNGNVINVLDDSWNATVSSMLNAFDELKQRQVTGRKIAVLGRIVHLGELAADLHASLAPSLLASNIDLVLTHGDEMQHLRKQLPNSLLGQHFSTATELSAELSRVVKPDDCVLLKGSRRDSDFGEVSHFCQQHKLTTTHLPESQPVKSSLNDGILSLLSQDPMYWAEFMGGEWIVPLKQEESIQNIAYLPKTIEAKSLAIPHQPGRDFGLTLQTIKKYRTNISAIIGSSSTPPVEGIAYLRVPGAIPSLNKLATKSRELFNGKVIAVTGSAGKSSTCHMLRNTLEMLTDITNISGTEKNENLQLGVMRALCTLSNKVSYAVLEVAAGHAKRCSQMAQPHIAVFTNVSYAHASRYGSLENIADRKSGVFAHMSADGVAIICRDIPLYKRIANHATSAGASLLSYGAHAEADIHLIAYDPASGEVKASTPTGTVNYILEARGEHFVSNSLAVLAVLVALKLDSRVISSLVNWQPLDGRGAAYQLTMPNGANVELIDESFNAAPIAMEAALSALANRRTAGRKVAVLGPMHELGPEEIRIHTDMANLLATLPIDRVHIYGEQYRDFWNTLPAAKRGIYASNINELGQAVLADLQPDDTILCKGSHASHIYQVVACLRKNLDSVSNERRSHAQQP